MKSMQFTTAMFLFSLVFLTDAIFNWSSFEEIWRLECGPSSDIKIKNTLSYFTFGSVFMAFMAAIVNALQSNNKAFWILNFATLLSLLIAVLIVYFHANDITKCDIFMFHPNTVITANLLVAIIYLSVIVNMKKQKRREGNMP